MGHRAALKIQTVLPFEKIPCRIDGVLGRGNNAITYYGHGFPMEGGRSVQNVLIQELFPSHPQGMIYRGSNDWIRRDFEAEPFFDRHRESFLCTQEIHDRWAASKPELSGCAMDVYHCNGTLYTLVPFSGVTTLGEALKDAESSVQCHVDRILGLLDSLEAYHRCGYLHLGIDPDHILLVDTKEAERVYLLQNEVFADYREQDEVIYRPGYAPPEMESGFSEMLDFSTDLYSVAAVFFHCLMGRAMSLEELLDSGTPSVRESPCLAAEPYPVRQMVNRILKKGLQVLPSKRYRSISQMRKVFQELNKRIRNHGVTHWSIWENGRRSAEEWLRSLPGNQPLDPLLDAWRQQGKRYSPSVPALLRIPLAQADGESEYGIRRQILSSLRVEYGSGAAEALDGLLKVPAETGPVMLVLEDLEGFSDSKEELDTLSRMEGLRMLDEAGKSVTADRLADRKDTSGKSWLQTQEEESGGKSPDAAGNEGSSTDVFEENTIFGGKAMEDFLPEYGNGFSGDL